MRLTQAKLKENLHYNPNTGIFVWLKDRNRALAGACAGSINSYGYNLIMINNKKYRAGRLAWLYIHGYLPENEIDHVNQNKSDDRIKNLREASRQCNMRNTGTPKNNTSGIKGVSWRKSLRKWLARITVNRSAKHIGCHADFLEAVCHRLAAEQCLDWGLCDSSSSAYQYVKKHIKIK